MKYPILYQVQQYNNTRNSYSRSITTFNDSSYCKSVFDGYTVRKFPSKSVILTC